MMPEYTINPEELAERLDRVLPPDTQIIADYDEDPMVQLATRLASERRHQLSDVSRQVIQDKMLSELTQQQKKGRYRKSILTPFLRMVAVFVLMTGIATIALTNDSGDVFLALQGLIGGAEETPTEIPLNPTETLTFTPTDEPTPIPTLTATTVPSATPTDEPAATVMPQTIIVPVPDTVMMIATGEAQILYTDPSMASVAITALASGTDVTVTGYDESADWALVRLADETEGWLQATVLALPIVPTDTPVQVTSIPDNPQNTNPPPANNNGNTNPPPANNNNPPANNNNGNGGNIGNGNNTPLPDQGGNGGNNGNGTGRPGGGNGGGGNGGGGGNRPPGGRP